MRDFNFKSNSIVIFIYLYENLTHFPVQNLLELDFEKKLQERLQEKSRETFQEKLQERF